MKLFTKDIDKKLFAQYTKGSDLANQMVVAKIFNPYGRGTWYIINSDPDDPDYLWAIVDLMDVEVGSVSRSELESILVPPFRLNLERDTSFSPTNALELYNGLRSGKMYQTGGTADSAMSNDPMIGGTMASSMARGGELKSENAQMVANNVKQIAHHTKEMADALKDADHVPAWVVSKVYRAASDLSDATHYMEGENSKMAEGGNVFVSDVAIVPDKDGNNYLFPNPTDVNATGMMMEQGGDVYSYDTQDGEFMADGGKANESNFGKPGTGFDNPKYNSKKSTISEFYGNKAVSLTPFSDMRMLGANIKIERNSDNTYSWVAYDNKGMPFKKGQKFQSSDEAIVDFENTKFESGGGVGEMKQLWFVTDNRGAVKNISTSINAAEIFLASALKYDGVINYVKVPIKDWESEKINVGNIRSYASSFWKKYSNGGVAGDEFSQQDFDKLKKGDEIMITYESGISRSNNVSLQVKSKTIVGKGKSYQSEKITFINKENPTGVKYYAYKRANGNVGFAIGDMAIWGVQQTNKMAEGGATPAQKRKIGKVMREWKEGELNIGKSDKKVKSQKQAVAIALSQAGLSKKEEGGKMMGWKHKRK